MMFSVFCPTHDATVLMTRRNAISFWNGPNGSVIRWKCSCGHEGTLDANGSHADETNHDARSPIAPAATSANATSSGPIASDIDVCV